MNNGINWLVLILVAYVNGFLKALEGLNGGGDPWRTDGRLGAVVLKK